jgi:hypothetical protein
MKLMMRCQTSKGKSMAKESLEQFLAGSVATVFGCKEAYLNKYVPV